MDLTWHFMQAAGAAAVAAMTGRPTPAHVRAGDLDRAVRTIVDDAAAAARAPKKGPGYAWQMALAAAYPNSPATHPARGTWSEQDLRARLQELFAPDAEDAPWACWACQGPASHRWGKSLWPLTDSAREINTVPRTAYGRAQGGMPACRSCRIAVWALPYASSHDGAHITSIDAFDDVDLLMGTARLLVPHNRAVIDAREAAWPHPRTPAGLRELLTQGALTLHVWRNDNRDPTVVSQFLPAAAPPPAPDRTTRSRHTSTHTRGATR
ncbi:hypothetical protein ABZ234_08655 [Nocardiopsis sp. NPDC006198]|uniref:hypothetical protein n=1 Tax=Nocardiopsis sp. NPDC006198 TaxID=3154472 RepID=UPI0033B2B862